MSIHFDELQKRHAKRSQIIRESRQLKPPMLTDAESVKEFQKLLKEKQSDLINECFLVDQDVQVLLVALRDLTKDAHEAAAVVGRAWDKCWTNVPLEEQEIYYRRQTEAAEKAAKATGETPGQMKLVKDDGSIAESASAVKTSKAK